MPLTITKGEWRTRAGHIVRIIEEIPVDVDDEMPGPNMRGEFVSGPDKGKRYYWFNDGAFFRGSTDDNDLVIAAHYFQEIPQKENKQPAAYAQLAPRTTHVTDKSMKRRYARHLAEAILPALLTAGHPWKDCATIAYDLAEDMMREENTRYGN